MPKKPSELSFLGHLDELRWRLVICLLALTLACFIFYSCIDQFLSFVVKPVGKLVFTSPADAFMARIKLTVWGGLFLSSPVIIYQIWQFVSSALKPSERQFIQWVLPFSIILFNVGIAFGYWVMVPISIHFLMNFSSELLVPMITVNNYISFLGTFVFGFGITFELPLVLAFLIKIGIATPEFLIHYRSHAIVIILIISAVMTPPDVVSQLLMAVPLCVLYEISIFVCKIAFRKK